MDRREKLRAYQAIASLRYYLMIASDQQAVEYYIRNNEQEWRTAHLEKGELIKIECGTYCAKLDLQDIYEDVVLLS